MDSSPRSTVSSDLYPPSESAQPEPTLGTHGIQLEVSRKRKWEEDPKSNTTVQINGGSQVCHAILGRHASAEQLTSSLQANSFDERPSKLKRPRPNADGFETGARFSSTSFALPAALWQHIFCYLPPVSLGRMLSVNHAFNALLTPDPMEEDPIASSNSILQPLKAEAIWAISRRRFYPWTPKPIHGLNELEMWRLLKGSNCQICKKTRSGTPTASSQDSWESGPGDTGVRIIWPFGLRCCGPCLQENTQKVSECRHLR